MIRPQIAYMLFSAVRVEQDGHDSVREVELWQASATWSVSSLASSPVVSSGFALIGPRIGEGGGQPGQGLVRHSGQRRVVGGSTITGNGIGAGVVRAKAFVLGSGGMRRRVQGAVPVSVEVVAGDR